MATFTNNSDNSLNAAPDSPTQKAVNEKPRTGRFWSEKKGSDQLEPLDHYALAKEAGIKPAFLAKVDVLNEAIKEIGMGRFQYELFFTAGEWKIFTYPSLFVILDESV